jgi:ABC-type lipoprotein export system ATPase subunit
MISQPSDSAEPILAMSRACRSFVAGRRQVHAVIDADLEVRPGQFLIIRGPSGSGKSTLLHLLGGVDRPTTGTLTVHGVALHTASETELTHFRREHIGFVFQFYNLLPSLSAEDNVALPLLARGFSRREARRQAEDTLAQVGLTQRRSHRPGELSGGEQQRVAIARAIIGRPALVLADEPTGDLDSATAVTIMELIADLNQQLGLAFIIATHNLQLSSYANRIIELRDGRVVQEK